MAGALAEPAPRRRSFAGTLAQPLRYGENPHQGAAFYRDGSGRPGVATARQLQGKALSYNNINDTDAAFELVAEFAPEDGPACAIIKHANPCGVARGATPARRLPRRLRLRPHLGLRRHRGAERPARRRDGGGDRRDLHRGGDRARRRARPPREVFAAKKNLRLLVTGGLPDPRAPGLAWRQVAGGFLVQGRDSGRLEPARSASSPAARPTAAELADLRFAWTVAKHVKSNAIVYAKGGATVGIGAGQMSRVDSTRIAARKARDMAEALGLAAPPTQGAVVASDAFFPFADGLLAAAEAGATAVIQPGGSVRDEEVIAAADAAGLAMVFTGIRHFRH